MEELHKLESINRKATELNHGNKKLQVQILDTAILKTF